MVNAPHDDHVAFPLLRADKYKNARHQEAHLEVQRPLAGGAERVQFLVPYFSEADNKDVESFFDTLQKFELYARTQGIWDDDNPAAQQADLFAKFLLCLESSAKDKW